MKFDLSGVDAAAEGRPMTNPGTIAVFAVEEIEFKEKDDGKEYFEVTLGRPEDSFREYFYLTEKAAERFVYFWSKVMDGAAMPESETGIIAALKGKEVALKVTGSVNNQSGKGYPGLPYSGFARPVAEMADLSFSNNEKGKIAAAIEAQTQSSNAAPGAAAATTQMAATASDDKF
jgi:hypothetical protein